MKGYPQLVHEQRYQIFAFMKAGHNQTEISEIIGVHKSTISRETRDAFRNMMSETTVQPEDLEIYNAKEDAFFQSYICWVAIGEAPIASKVLHVVSGTLSNKGFMNQFY